MGPVADDLSDDEMMIGCPAGRILSRAVRSRWRVTLHREETDLMSNSTPALHALQKMNKTPGMRVESYGTGTQVRLPGKTAMEPRIFKFGTPYAEMYRSLAATPEDEAFFVHNGVLQLCKRGSSVKVSDLRTSVSGHSACANYSLSLR